MLETKDLILGKARFEDWEAMYRNVWSRPESFRYMVLELSPDPAEAQARMHRTIAFQAERETAYTVFLKATREAIGFAGIAQVEGDTWEESGICLGPDYWGRGFGRQVLDCLLDHARERGAKVFLYSSWEENGASRALAAKAGFAQYALEQHTRPHDGYGYKLLKYRKDM
ncbi:GNAT family N-acetyltransferase [Acutalibacter caecimuris]|uniref:GNAT family N-acetyltransferase n=1 Tax=Acutalibacter caecimuris TaxID=3093657 RepID=UPI002AC9788A|nr:GNAT family N-acetyltransferase [Acutalibacter sp. M00118]